MTKTVSIAIYDVAGRLMGTLVDQDLRAGMHAATFGDGLGRGVRLYFYLLEWSGGRASGKVVLVD